MCEINSKTVEMATANTIKKLNAENEIKGNKNDTIDLHVTYRFGEYKASIPMKEVQAAYGRAIEKVEKKYG